MRIKKSGQLSLEFIIFISFAMLIMLSFLGMIYEREKMLRDHYEIKMIREIALKIQYEIDTAAVVSDGYSRNFTIPQNIYGRNYQALIIGNYVLVLSDKYSELLSIIPVSGYIKTGVNNIQKQNGTICINMAECP
ncbi:MAG: hypothetical protein QXW00_01800 [Candidatus Woesearchaeota archaeon]